jgi:peptide chain release factor 3
VTAAAYPPADQDDVVAEATRRRTFAVISHPDAGKSTLTEALALHAHAIGQAGVVQGKGARRGVTSDWMELERDRGISVTSAVLQFRYADAVINLLDTPGHADFSEDTYRVLTAVDAAIMLLDAAKGLEPQTLKLFDVCRNHHVPVIAYVNKWDRPGREPLELLDEIESQLRLRPTPLTWPVGIAGDFRGILDQSSGDYVQFARAAGGGVAAEQAYTAGQVPAVDRQAWQVAVEELALLDEIGATVDMPSFLAGESAPVLFGAALPNFGVRRLLQAMVDLAPAPAPRIDIRSGRRALDAAFSGFVFKVQANMNPAHRDRIAFLRVCSGRFDRGMVATNARTGKPFATKYAQAAFGRDRRAIDVAYPGDVVGLVNATALRVGDTLYAGPPVEYPPIPAFAPEHFTVARVRDSGRAKQFRRGLAQLAEEGVVQVLRSPRRGDAAPVLAAVGPLQFDVATHRLTSEYGAAVTLEPLGYQVARRTDADGAASLQTASGVEIVTRDGDGAILALFPDRWRLGTVARAQPDVTLEPLLADTQTT